MRPFEYASPTEVAQVAPLLDGQDAAILAGGTDLLALMKDEIVTPKRVVNIKSLQMLTGINQRGRTQTTQQSLGTAVERTIPVHLIKSSDKNHVRIGALTRLQDLADNVVVRKSCPALAEAIDNAASPQIRNMATIGGNLLQRPRCWYYRNGFGLLALDKNGESLIRKGDNRWHAILGNNGPALFVSPSTIAPVLIACRASVVIEDAHGVNRVISLEGLYRIPSKESEREHAISPAELMTEVFFGTEPGNVGVYEVRQKHAFDWPLATAAVALQMDGKTVKSARVVMGHVAPIPWISKEAEAAIVGKTVNEQTAEAAGAAAVQNAKSLGHNSHKIQCAKIAVKRAIMKAAGLPVA